MTESVELRFGGQEAEFLAVLVHGRTYPGEADFHDANWLNAEVRVMAGGFRGKAKGCLRAEEFEAFGKQVARLYKRLTGKATFETMEQWVSVVLSGGGQGHIELKGTLLDEVGTGNRLSFKLDLDQTDLRPAIESLETIASQYPVRSRLRLTSWRRGGESAR